MPSKTGTPPEQQAAFAWLWGDAGTTSGGGPAQLSVS
jgi:hypothetical protein